MPFIDDQLFKVYSVMFAVELMSGVLTKAEVFRAAVLLPMNKFLPKPIPSLLLTFKVRFSKKSVTDPVVIFAQRISPNELL